jgi:hypothetical protein
VAVLRGQLRQPARRSVQAGDSPVRGRSAATAERIGSTVVGELAD